MADRPAPQADDDVTLAKRATAATLAGLQAGGPKEIIANVAAAVVKALDDGSCERYINSAPIFDEGHGVMIGFGIEGNPPAERQEAVRELSRRCHEGMQGVLEQLKVHYTPQGEGALSFDTADFGGAILPVITEQGTLLARKTAANKLLGASISVVGSSPYLNTLKAHHESRGEKPQNPLRFN